MNDNVITNIAAFLDEAEQKYPYKRAIVVPNGYDRNGRTLYSHLTFLELNHEVNRAANAFAAIGITRGVRTIVMVTMGYDCFVIFFALLKLGAVPVVVDPGMGLDRMVECFQSTKPQAMISIPKAHLLRFKYAKAFSAVDTFVSTDRFIWKKCHNYRKIIQNQPASFKIAPTRASDTAAILFTTGSTGPARGAIYTHGGFQAQLNHIQKHLQLTSDEIDLSTYPMFALFYPAMGVTAIIPDMDPTKPAEVDPTKIIEAIENQGVTNMFASPALLKRVGEYGVAHKIRLPSLRRVISAGAPVPAQTIAIFAQMLNENAVIHTPYGATEAVPVTDITSTEILAKTAAMTAKGFGICVGRPINDIELKIIKIDDNPILEWRDELEVKTWEIGEIVVRAGHVSPGYHNNTKHDALCKIHDNGTIWHRMGDLGWRDDEGRVWYCGRKGHRVITANGELYTEPCEAIFNNHQAVNRSALVGYGPARGKMPVMCIETKIPLDDRQKRRLEQELREIAAANNITKNILHFMFVDKFPVDIRHNSKIYREELTVMAEERYAVRRTNAKGVALNVKRR